MSPDAALITAIDARLNDWNQGDVVLGATIPFVYVADYRKPITSGSQQAAAADTEGHEQLGTVAVDVPGIVVITQSCDLVRSCAEQPFVKVAILQKVSDDFVEDVRKARRPRYAYIPGIADRLLVANPMQLAPSKKPSLQLLNRGIAFAAADQTMKFVSLRSRFPGILIDLHSRMISRPL